MGGKGNNGYCIVLPRTLFGTKDLDSSAAGSAAGRKLLSVINSAEESQLIEGESSLLGWHTSTE